MAPDGPRRLGDTADVAGNRASYGVESLMGSAATRAAGRTRPVGRVGILLGVVALAATVVLGIPRTTSTAVPPPPVPGTAVPQPEAIAFFDKLALNRGTPGGGERAGYVRRFTVPVAIELSGNENSAVRARAGRIAAELSELTGLEFYVGKRRHWRHARLEIEVVDAAEMQRRYGGPVCFCRNWGNGGRLKRARIEVSSAYADCLSHEFMHAAGFDNHWTGRMATAERPSVLADRYHSARTMDFSDLDRLAIRALYDPRLRPGMSRRAALPLAAAIFGAAPKQANLTE